jgi:Golgi phosphoprotein 3 (GPP34)
VNLAEELNLCALDDDGQPAQSHKLPYGFGAALLAELVLAGRVRINETVAVESGDPTGDALVDEVLAGLQDPAVQQLAAPQLMGNIGKNSGPRIWNGIVEGGLATVEQGERSWMYVVRKPDRLVPTAAGEEVRARARGALQGETAPDPRTAALVGLVEVCGLVGQLVPKEQRKAAEERAAELARQQPTTDDLRKAIEGARAAVAAVTS